MKLGVFLTALTAAASLSMSNTQTTNYATLSTRELSEKFIELRSLKGHWDDSENGGQFNPIVDSSKGEKFLVMDELLHRFEAPGTPAASVIDSLGQPDLVSSSDPFSSINPPLMPGLQMPTDFVPPSANPTTPGSGATAAKNSSPQQLNLIYSWRGKHDYIVFCIDESTNLVMTAGWYNAFE